MRKALIWLLAFTWELPQTILALILMLLLHVQKYDGKGRIRLLHHNSFLTSFSLGEFIFFNQWEPYHNSWDETQRHEAGHSVQSRIFGPLYLILIALPSVIWNLLSRMKGKTGNWFHRLYYRTPWEHGADVLGKVTRN